ncbi:DUF3592 domain-containing protein [Runella sp.]|uniref:DUF3592 domain-containing protein n=1 Tax=Runella sp. TaxID=1960881 RepID=UPI003D1041D0
MKNNFWVLFFGIFAVIGTVFGVVAYYAWDADQYIRRNGVETTGTVVSFNRNSKGSSAPVISYTTQSGETLTYYSSTYSSPSAYDAGEEVKLWYLPNEPQELVLAGIDSWLLPAIFGGFFVIFGGIGYGGFIWLWRRKRRTDWLNANGQSIFTDVVDVRYNTSIAVGGKSPWIIVSQYFDPNSQKVYTYESSSIWFNPTPFLSREQKIKVRVSPTDYNVYDVDTSFLPQMGN